MGLGGVGGTWFACNGARGRKESEGQSIGGRKAAWWGRLPKQARQRQLLVCSCRSSQAAARSGTRHHQVIRSLAMAEGRCARRCVMRVLLSEGQGSTGREKHQRTKEGADPPLAGRPGPDHGPSMRARTGRPSPPPPPTPTPPSPSPFIIHGPSSIRQAPSAAFVNRPRRALLSPGKRDSMRSRVFVSMDRHGTHQARGKGAQ